MGFEGLELRSLIKKGGELELSLVKVKIPEPAPDEVIVRIEGAPINPSDLGLLIGAADMSTVNSDRMLLAHACARLFDFDGQVYWADQVLREMPDHLYAVRVKVAGFTNLALSGKRSEDSDWQQVEKELKWLHDRDLVFPDTAFLSGCYSLKILGDREKAGQIWQQALNDYPEKELYLAALIYSGFRALSISLDCKPGSLLWYLKIRDGLLPNEAPEKFKQMHRAARFFFGD